jgi:hypothetical protein
MNWLQKYSPLFERDFVELTREEKDRMISSLQRLLN